MPIREVPLGRGDDAIAWSRAALALRPAKPSPGVHKFHSYEEMKSRA